MKEKNLKDLKIIKNFPIHLIKKEILLNNFKNLEDISSLQLKDIFIFYFHFITDNLCNENKASNIIFYSILIELIDIIISKKEKEFLEFEKLFEETIDSLCYIFKKIITNLIFLL